MQDQPPHLLPPDLPEESQHLLKIIQPLMEPCDRATYGQRLKEAAAKLNKSVRTVQRLVKRWQQDGISAFIQGQRQDKGQHRISQDWQEFIVKTYTSGNKGGKRMTPAQVAIRVKIRAQQTGLEQYPSHMTVYRVLEPLVERNDKSIRSPGWRGSRLSVKTRDGLHLCVEFSNQVWQCDHTPADILLVDQQGELLGRPWLTTVIDTYSRSIVGINLGFDAPSSHVVALALRHAILPKSYGLDYQLQCDWGTYGLPQSFYTDGGKDFRSDHLQQIAAQLGFVCHLRNRPSEGGVVERPFGTISRDLFATLPGYTGSSVADRPKEAETSACLTLSELERMLVRYIVDNYNQRSDPRCGDQTRFQRWEGGLAVLPKLPQERELDICLMKAARRQVQRGGCIQFENLIYRGEHLSGYLAQTVILRFDPRDITTILIYHQEQGRESFLCRAHAQDLETTELSLADAKASAKRLRQKGRELSNQSILAEVAERQVKVPKLTRKERQKAEQQKIQRPVETPETDSSDEDPQPNLPMERPRIWDAHQLEEDFQW